MSRTDEPDIPSRFDDLTQKQQAVIIEHLRDPDRTNIEIQEAAGASDSYISSVKPFERWEGLINELRGRLETENITIRQLEVAAGLKPSVSPNGDVTLNAEDVDELESRIGYLEEIAELHLEAAAPDSTLASVSRAELALLDRFRSFLADRAH